MSGPERVLESEGNGGPSSRSSAPQLAPIGFHDEARNRHSQPDTAPLISTGTSISSASDPPPESPRPHSPTQSSEHDNNNGEQKASRKAPMVVHPYAPLLNCPVCVPPARLHHPTTLHCGHTVCIDHIYDGSSSPHASSSKADSPSKPWVCPLPSCRATHLKPILAPNIPLESTVRYYPPLSSALVTTNEEVALDGKEPKVDVLVGRVMDLVGLMERGGSHIDSVQRDDESDGTSGSDDDDTEKSEHTDDGHTRTQRHNIESTTPRSRRRPRHCKRYPRKRVRRDLGHQSPRSCLRSPRDSDMSDFLKELNDVLTCDICSCLLYQPVTTPCQHTFCAKCLQRSLDHGTSCPLCREVLPSYSYFQEHPLNKLIYAILLKAFESQYGDRKLALEEEEKSGRCKTPLFVSQLSFPGIPTLLHLYEPRYRLMLRRVLETPHPAFGMIVPPPPASQRAASTPVGEYGHGYGTMLELRSVQMLPDGRSIVESVGAERFRVMETGCVDGYLVGRVERVNDVPEEIEEEAELSIASLTTLGSSKKLAPSLEAMPGAGTGVELSETSSSAIASSSTMVPEASSMKEGMPSSVTNVPAKSHSQPLSAESSLPPTTEELVAICHAFVAQLRNGTAPWVVQRLNNAYGPEPKDIASFSFWMAQVLPIEDHEKSKLLVIRSPRARLRLVVHWIEQLNSNCWTHADRGRPMGRLHLRLLIGGFRTVARLLEKIAGWHIRSSSSFFAAVCFLERWLLFCAVLLMAYMFGRSEG